MMYQIAVITEVPDPEKDDGNLAAPMCYGEDKSLRLAALMHLRVEVFSVGEILILDASGREVSGYGRKPSKWDVQTEYFETLEEAVNRAVEVKTW